MAALITTPNLSAPDDIYAALVALHEGQSPTDSLKIWSRLVLTLANHIGDPQVIAQAIALAAPKAHPGDPNQGGDPCGAGALDRLSGIMSET